MVSIQRTRLAKINKYLPKNISELSEEEIKKQILMLALKYNVLKEETTPTVTTSSVKKESSSLRSKRSLSANASGNNVTNQIDFTNTTINVKNNTVKPLNAESYNLLTSFKTNSSVKKGDYFIIKGSANTINDDLNHQNSSAPVIKDKNGNIIAIGIYDPKTREYKYTFTDFVEDKASISGSLKFSQYINRDTVRNNSNETITYTFGDNVL